MKQTERLSLYLEKNKTINPLQAWQHLGIYRLAAVVFVLKNQGYKITTNKVEVKNQFNESCHVAQYELESVC